MYFCRRHGLLRKKDALKEPEASSSPFVCKWNFNHKMKLTVTELFFLLVSAALTKAYSSYMPCKYVSWKVKPVIFDYCMVCSPGKCIVTKRRLVFKYLLFLGICTQTTKPFSTLLLLFVRLSATTSLFKTENSYKFQIHIYVFRWPLFEIRI